MQIEKSCELIILNIVKISVRNIGEIKIFSESQKKLRELRIKHTCHTKVVEGSYLNRKHTITKGTQKSGTRNEHGKQKYG